MAKNLNEYKQLSQAVDLIPLAFINSEVCVGLIKRETYPYEGLQTLPGGFIHYEDLGFEDSIKRVIETKLIKEGELFDFKAEQIGSEMGLNRDPRGHVISIFYSLYVDQPEKMNTDLNWVPINEVPKLGFDHNSILNKAIKFLANCMDYRPTALLMVKEFTLTEAIQIQASLENKDVKEYNRANYRKSHEQFFIETLNVKSEGAGRPAKIYTNKDFETTIKIKNEVH